MKRTFWQNVKFIVGRYTDRSSDNETIGELLLACSKRNPNDPVFQKWEAEYQLQQRHERGERSHDA